MTYLYNKNVNVLNANAIVTTSNPFPVTAVGDGLEVKGISPDAFGRTRVSELFQMEQSHTLRIKPAQHSQPIVILLRMRFTRLNSTTTINQEKVN